MSVSDDGISRRSFLERVALAAGLTAAGELLENLNPEAATAAATMSSSAAALVNSGAVAWPLLSDPKSDAPANLITNPNILMIMVDQLRLPQFWLNSSQQATVDAICPNIAWLRKTSYRFWNFYIAAQACTPSRATLLTGLYAPQVGLFSTQIVQNAPVLNPGFPTFGTALADIAGYNPNNILWFGKWHLSNVFNGANGGTDTLPNYGFNTGRSGNIRWPSFYGSPNGTANQANNGYLLSPQGGTPSSLACDQSIASDFADTWANHRPSSPWFACVSFVNPHDMHYYPGFFPPNELANPGNQGICLDPQNEPPNGNFEPHYSSYKTQVISALPNGFNYETTLDLESKSWDVTATIQDANNFLQSEYQQEITDVTANLQEGSPDQHASILASNQYIAFINWYYYMISLVDANIGQVLATAIPNYNNTSFQNPSSDTAIVFLSDHGEYAGSHGLHGKGGAIYEEALRVPFYVVTPSQRGSADVFQMCSMVDVFKLIVELALGSPYTGWRTNAKYKDQYNNINQSLVSFIQNQSTIEPRGFHGSDGNWYPFVLSTTDETAFDAAAWKNPVVYYFNCALRNHVMCMRTKSDSNFQNATSSSGAKLALYSKWVLNPSSYTAPIVDGTLAAGGLIVQDYEYYDYLNYNNRAETGNDYPAALKGQDSHGIAGSGPGAQRLLNDMKNHFGNMQIQPAAGSIQPASGFVASMLTRPLAGISNSTPLSNYTVAGVQAWYNWLHTLLHNIDAGCSI